MSPPLSALFASALDKARRASELPTIQDETQELIQDALSELIQLASRIAGLSLFSANEVLDDMSTSDLVYLSVPFIRAEIQNRVRSADRDERLRNLVQIQCCLNVYTSSLESYDIVPEVERTLYDQQSWSTRDAAKRRDAKIRQYKAEKDLRARIKVIRRHRQQLLSMDGSFNDFELVASLLPTLDDNAKDVETEDILREATLLLLRLFYVQGRTQLEGVDQEIQLLSNAPPSLPKLPVDGQRNKTKDQEDVWKVDAVPEFPNREPLLDSYGKPMRSFTFLPTGTPDRSRLHAQVFGPGYRLPTLTIDEYLEIERQRGGILSNGGPQSEAKPTASEQLTIDSEMNGTVLGELKAEEKRRNDEQWAQYKDIHPKGAGNTMNRG